MKKLLTLKELDQFSTVWLNIVEFSPTYRILWPYSAIQIKIMS